MKLKLTRVAIIILTSLFTLAGCNNITRNGVKFNKAQWDTAGDLHSYPNREDMLNDLIGFHKIKGLNYHQLIDSLGLPENYGGQNDSIRYDIVSITATLILSPANIWPFV